MEIFEHRSVELIRTVLCDHVHDATERPAILRVEVRVLNAKFGDGIGSGDVRNRGSLNQAGDAIDKHFVGAGTAAVNHHAGRTGDIERPDSGDRSRFNHTRRRPRCRKWIPAHQRDAQHALRADGQSTVGRLGLQGFHAGSYGNALRHLAQREGQIRGGACGHLQLYPFAHQGLEAGFLHRQYVVARRQIPKPIGSVVGRSGCRREAGRRALNSYFRCCDGSSGRIGYSSRQRRPKLLGLQDGGGNQKNQNSSTTIPRWTVGPQFSKTRRCFHLLRVYN